MDQYIDCVVSVYGDSRVVEDLLAVLRSKLEEKGVTVRIVSGTVREDAPPDW